MWLAIAELVRNAGCTLSLYADDITISGAIVRKQLIWEVKKIVHRNGLRLKASKEVSLINSAADITGVIVKNGTTLLPNRQHQRLAELRRERALAVGARKKAKLDIKIAGRLAQKRQVERPKKLD